MLRSFKSFWIFAGIEKIGGVVAKSPADVGEQCNIVLSLVPTAEAMDEVIEGPKGLIHSAWPGQIVVELGSHLVPDKESHVATLAKKGVAYIDGEVSGTPGMVTARKAVIYLGGDAEACKKVEPAITQKGECRGRLLVRTPWCFSAPAAIWHTINIFLLTWTVSRGTTPQRSRS